MLLSLNRDEGCDYFSNLEAIEISGFRQQYFAVDAVRFLQE
jgi:hypothetical protein